jgi:periplasmic protein CpxP/Spy
MSRLMIRLIVPFLTLVAAGELQAQRAVGGPPQGRDRAQLEERFRARFGEILKTRLSLSDAQLSQMIEVFMEERTVRKEMRDVLKGSEDQATQDRVAQLMDRALRVQRSRLDLMESEQRELSTFLTPVQRARYMGLQEQLRRRADEMRRRAEGDTLADSLVGPPVRAGQRRPMMRRPGA